MAVIKNLWNQPTGLGVHASEYYRAVGAKLVRDKVLRDIDYYNFCALSEHYEFYRHEMNAMQKTGNPDPETFERYQAAFQNYCKLCTYFGLL